MEESFYKFKDLQRQKINENNSRNEQKVIKNKMNKKGVSKEVNEMKTEKKVEKMLTIEN